MKSQNISNFVFLPSMRIMKFLNNLTLKLNNLICENVPRDMCINPSNLRSMKNRRRKDLGESWIRWEYQLNCRLSLLSNKRISRFALLSFQKLKWLDEKLSKVNKANKFSPGNIQNGSLRIILKEYSEGVFQNVKNLF